MRIGEFSDMTVSAINVKQTSDPGEACPLPVEAVYEKRFRLRPLRESRSGG